MRWIVDDGPFEILAALGQKDRLRSYPPGRLLVAPTTGRSCSGNRRDLLEMPTTGGEPLFDVIEFFLDDPVARIFTELHGEEKSTTNAAERESIAFAQVHAEDAVFVTADKRAALTALAELGRARVAHPFDLWLELLEMGALSVATFRQLCEQTKRKDQGLERMPDRVAVHFE